MQDKLGLKLSTLGCQGVIFVFACFYQPEIHFIFPPEKVQLSQKRRPAIWIASNVRTLFGFQSSRAMRMRNSDHAFRPGKYLELDYMRIASILLKNYPRLLSG
jgi:hypothetical protein